MKERLIIATVKSWNTRNANAFIAKHRGRYDIKLVTGRDALSAAAVKQFAPRFIFFPHWSWLIPETIYGNFECVVFHMTDLPFGRGGSPLQNLIMRGFKKTKISAFRAGREMDSGPVYMKAPVDLRGSAGEIYERISRVVFEKMMPCILTGRSLPRPQKGAPVFFARRKPEDSRIPAAAGPSKLYDLIRMLDAEGYPPAFLETGAVRIEFSSACMRGRFLEAKVLIKPKEPICKRKF